MFRWMSGGMATTLMLAAGAGTAQTPAKSPAPPSAARAPAGQAQDAEYTALMRKYLSDPRISTELVDHLPASNKVPTPLKFLGRIIGTPGELTHAKDIHAYMAA